MSDTDPKNSAEEETERASGDQAHPEQEAHGGSMAPGLVDDAGHPVAEPPPASPDNG
jgi:hypothetical protein